jgi:fructuronate reductase
VALVRLEPARLPALPAHVQRPRYDRAALPVGIVHLGLGAFVRAHLAPLTDDALDAGAAPAWGVCGVSLRSPATRDALAPQHGLYALALRDDGGESLRIVGCLRECLVAPDDPPVVVERIAAAGTRLVSLTITEKGYGRDAHGAVGLIVRGLALRRARGLGGITLLSLDNLAGNGDTLARLAADVAGPTDPALADWIEARCTFPNSMVDRIVPRTTDTDRARIADALGCSDAWPVVAEPFLDWAVEDRFAAGRPDWPGVRFVDRAAPWETLKLRMVNGAHSTLAYLALGAGWRTVDEAVAEEPLRRHLQALWRDEIEPTLPALHGLDLADYRARLLARLANPALAHRSAQIAMDGSQKLPPRLLGAMRERLRAGQPVARLALGVAAWLHHLRGHDDAGTPYALDDPLASALVALHAEVQRLPDEPARADAFTRFAPVFGDLAGAPALVDALARHLRSLREHGVVATLERLP